MGLRALERKACALFNKETRWVAAELRSTHPKLSASII